MFHHEAGGRASFRHSGKPRGGPIKPQPGARPAHEHGKAVPNEPEKHQAAEAETPHVRETHPGETQPHEHTGVHAFHAHHVGGGRYHSDTHHGDGSVEHNEHPHHEHMMAAMHEAFPPQEQADEEHEGPADGSEYAEELAEGVGGVEAA
jgi:hypothetical protein